MHFFSSKTDELRSDYEKLIINSQEKDEKIESAQKNAEELRKQLDVCKTEMRSLSEVIQNHENEITIHRKERNDALDERDQLQNVVDRQDCNMERLQNILTMLEKQLVDATAAKNEALSKCTEIESREHSITSKRKFMDQERELLNTQINNLSENLQKTSAELMFTRKENINSKLQLESELTNKINDLQFANSAMNQYIETNHQLTAQAEELNEKLREQSEESTKMLEHYHKELLNQTKLSELYLQNIDDRTSENTDLKNACAELRKHVGEKTDSNEELERKLHDMEVVHQKVLDAKNGHIKELVDELNNTNEKLKVSIEENRQDALRRLSPTAVAASCLLNSNIKLSELYNLHVKALENLQLKEKELNHAEVTLKTILTELEKLVPTRKQDAIDFQNISADNAELSYQLEQFVNESAKIRQELIESKARFGNIERENKKLKSSQGDLGKQVVYLLKEIEEIRGGFTSNQDQSISSDNTSTSELISKRLVTFNDIVELQDNNQKLLMLVRDFSSELDEIEEAQNNTNLAVYETKIAQYTRRVQDMEAASKEQTILFTACLRQKCRFEKLYLDSLKHVGKIPSVSTENSMSAGDMQMGANESDNIVKDNTIAELEKRVEDYVCQMRTLKEENDKYRREKLANDKLANKDYLAMRNEALELTTSNCRLKTSANFYSHQIKLQQKETDVYKGQIQTLQERNRIYGKTISKLEVTILHLREQVSIVEQNCSSEELKCEDLRRQCLKLVEDTSQLKYERDALDRELLSINKLQNNLEKIKTSIERNGNDGHMMIEKRYANVQRECTTLRRRLQEEQDHCRDKSADLKRQHEIALKKMNDELAQSDTLRLQVQQARQELATKNLQIDDLNKKLQELLPTCKPDNPTSKADKKIKELQNIVEQRTVEVEKLKRDNIETNAKFEQLNKMEADREADSKDLYEIFKECKKQMAAELAASQLSETNLKSRVEEMETQLRMQIIGAQLVDTDSKNQLHKFQTELNEAVTKISEQTCELRELRGECQLLRSSLQTTEQKYSEEMILHSNDIQALTMCKDELNNVTDQIQKLREERDSNAEQLKSLRRELEVAFDQHRIEKNELETRLQSLSAQNTTLFDQLQVRSLDNFLVFYTFFFLYFYYEFNL